jgi:hypothetical protein
VSTTSRDAIEKQRVPHCDTDLLGSCDPCFINGSNCMVYDVFALNSQRTITCACADHPMFQADGSSHCCDSGQPISLPDFSEAVCRILQLHRFRHGCVCDSCSLHSDLQLSYNRYIRLVRPWCHRGTKGLSNQHVAVFATVATVAAELLGCWVCNLLLRVLLGSVSVIAQPSSSATVAHQAAVATPSGNAVQWSPGPGSFIVEHICHCASEFETTCRKCATSCYCYSGPAWKFNNPYAG